MNGEGTLEGKVVCVIGLGYVGLPLAEAFAAKLKVIGYDISPRKIASLKKTNALANLTFSDDAASIKNADVIIICVPTPVTESKDPDLSYVTGTARTIGRHLRKGATVVLESTVYPGVTEEIVGPAVAEESGLVCGRDFKLGYSPERINPGDDAHAIDKITKVVAGSDEETATMLSGLYGLVAADVFRARNIRTAEAAKVIENVQRDLNIALINELAIIFRKMDLDIRDVLDAAATKWNFQRYSPGLVGGHCIPVDPYYLVYKAEEIGYHPQVILSGRAINDSMPAYVAEMTIKALATSGSILKGARVLIVGLTYKENVADIRETPVKGIIKGLREYGVEPLGYDPLLGDASGEFGIDMVTSLKDIAVDAVVLAVVHTDMPDVSLDVLKNMMKATPILIDIRGYFSDLHLADRGFYYRTL